MKSSALPFLDSSDSRLKLTVKNRMRNIFVTQVDDTRYNKEENVSYIPVVTETSSRILEAGVNTLKKTLVLKKWAEVDEVQKRFALERQELHSRMQAVAQRRSELDIKQQQAKERAAKYEKFVADHEAKQRRVLRNYQLAREQNILKQKEIEHLAEELKQLQTTQQVLKETVAKYQIFEDFLMKTLDYLPNNSLEYGSDTSDSLFMPIIRRHETQSIIHQELLQRLWHLEEKLVQGQQQLQCMKNEHGVKKLLANKELSELQSQYETLKDVNMKKFSLQKEQWTSREKIKEMASLLMAIRDLAEHCYLPAHGPLENMRELTMMDMVKEYILDKADLEKRARRMMECGTVKRSTTAAFGDKKEKKSLKSNRSETKIKSSSKVSGNSE